MSCQVSGTMYIYLFIYKVMKYRKICIKYSTYFKKAVFHSRENIKAVFRSHENISCISLVKLDVLSAFSIDFLEPTSEFQMPVTFLLVDKNIHFLSSITRKFGNKFVGIC